MSTIGSKCSVCDTVIRNNDYRMVIKVLLTKKDRSTTLFDTYVCCEDRLCKAAIRDGLVLIRMSYKRPVEVEIEERKATH